jgi:hypothetical protein
MRVGACRITDCRVGEPGQSNPLKRGVRTSDGGLVVGWQITTLTVGIEGEIDTAFADLVRRRGLRGR